MGVLGSHASSHFVRASDQLAQFSSNGGSSLPQSSWLYPINASQTSAVEEENLPQVQVNFSAQFHLF